MDDWIIKLVPTLLAVTIIMVQIARNDGRNNERMKGVEKRLDDIHADVLRKDVFVSELKNVNGQIERIEDRVGELERKVFNGARR